MIQNQLVQWFFDIPVVTRLYFTTTLLLTASISLNLLSYFQIYLNYKLVFEEFQIWRLFTNFFYFGKLDMEWFFYMFFFINYSRMLEEGSFYGRTADFCFMLIYFASSFLVIGPFLKVPFLSTLLTFALTYVWSRKSPDVQLAFLGLFTFHAPYLPFVLVSMSAIFQKQIPYLHLISMFVGHVYYFLDDVWPSQPSSRGVRYLAAPRFVKVLFEQQNQQQVHEHED
ncbi:putative Der1-like family [Neoconidiobolus thromboides FSU 785]|nr:putative Der1-like family [Neoconidiobolus thromboides FSU 785]